MFYKRSMWPPSSAWTTSSPYENSSRSRMSRPTVLIAAVIPSFMSSIFAGSGGTKNFVLTPQEEVSHSVSLCVWPARCPDLTGPSVQRAEEIHCAWYCKTQLSEDLLKRGVTYQARLRVRPSEFQSLWSDWSPTASWTSSIGEASEPPSGSFAFIVGITVVGTTFSLFLAVLIFRTDKMTWVNTVKKIRAPPIPDPGKSFLQNNWVSPHFSSEYLKTSLRPEEILPVKSVDHMDGFAPCNRELELKEKMRSKYDSTGLSFSNPRYSHVWLPSAHSLTAGNLDPCAADSPCRPAVALVDDKSHIKDWDNILELLLKLPQGDSCEVIPVISDYAKIETLQVDCAQPPDTGVPSWEESGKPLQKCFDTAGSKSLSTQGPIQVCLDYERVHMLHDDSPELPSQDSGISSMGEEQGSQEESIEDILEEKPSKFMFPAVTSPPLPKFSSPFTPLSIYGACLSPHLQSLQALILESDTDLTSSVEPSSGAYLSVCRKRPEED
ncbi:uncharacterized protein LOC129182379 isoform X2 [Dunckerocampus dactyliophorus]|uniref:uncharacterized protein LOC129182379 isoform X2 n=1 Tax=Dunckerocampus dactyliophorus TaxID=161453 RepID=UPI0024063B8D|nr:uncharacterized protein LOC129182379 isoform X2 [Dunckerocampus dactyliophorus]